MKALFSKKASDMIGLDIGSRYVKAVHVEFNEDKKKILGYACEPILGNAFNEREIKDFDAISRALKKVQTSLKVKNKQTCIAVAGPSVISKIVYMDPNQTDFELESQIEIEADSLIPYPIDEVYLDFEEIKDSEAHIGKVEVLLCAAHRELVDSRITLVRETQLEPKVVDIEVNALANAFVHFGSLPDDEDCCCIGVGSSLLQICMIHNSEVTYTKEHAFGINKFVQDLSIIHNIDAQQIEEQLASGNAPNAWFEDTLPLFLSALQQQLQRALQMYCSSTHKNMPRKVFFTGGAAILGQVGNELSKDMGIEFEVFNPFESCELSEKVTLESLVKLAPQLAIACGLASRGLTQCHI